MDIGSGSAGPQSLVKSEDFLTAVILFTQAGDIEPQR